jgi:hypothetical protein
LFLARRWCVGIKNSELSAAAALSPVPTSLGKSALRRLMCCQ